MASERKGEVTAQHPGPRAQGPSGRASGKVWGGRTSALRQGGADHTDLGLVGFSLLLLPCPGVLPRGVGAMDHTILLDLKFLQKPGL